MKVLHAVCACAVLACANADKPKPAAASLGAQAMTFPEGTLDMTTAPPKVIDSAFRAWVVDLEPIVRARDSMLALARHDSGTARAFELFDAADALLGTMVSSGIPVTPFFHYRCDVPEVQCKNIDMLSDSLARFLRQRSLFYRENNGPQAGVRHGELLAMFSPYIPPAFLAFKQLMITDAAAWEEEGRGVIVPWNQLGELVAAWEGFVDANPGFPYIDGARKFFTTDRDLFIAGGEYDNLFRTPGASDTTLRAETRSAFDAFVKAHPTSATAQTITEYLGVLGANGNLQTPAVIAYLKSKHIQGNFQ